VLTIVKGLFPLDFVHHNPTLSQCQPVIEQLCPAYFSASGSLLMALRHLAQHYVAKLPTPVGFNPMSFLNVWRPDLVRFSVASKMLTISSGISISHWRSASPGLRWVSRLLRGLGKKRAFVVRGRLMNQQCAQFACTASLLMPVTVLQSKVNSLARARCLDFINFALRISRCDVLRAIPVECVYMNNNSALNTRTVVLHCQRYQ
jgi:hypothetical protein